LLLLLLWFASLLIDIQVDDFEDYGAGDTEVLFHGDAAPAESECDEDCQRVRGFKRGWNFNDF
jgi:hypothetical protein